MIIARYVFLSALYDWPIFTRATLILVQGQYLLKFNMRLLNYPHVDAPLTSYISLHRGPFSSSPVSPRLPRSPRCRWCEYAAMYIRAKNRASTVLSHVIPASFPPLRTYATISCFLVIKNRDIACIFMPAMPRR